MKIALVCLLASAGIFFGVSTLAVAHHVDGHGGREASGSNQAEERQAARERAAPQKAQRQRRERRAREAEARRRAAGEQERRTVAATAPAPRAAATKPAGDDEDEYPSFGLILIGALGAVGLAGVLIAARRRGA